MSFDNCNYYKYGFGFENIFNQLITTKDKKKELLKTILNQIKSALNMSHNESLYINRWIKRKIKYTEYSINGDGITTTKKIIDFLYDELDNNVGKAVINSISGININRQSVTDNLVCNNSNIIPVNNTQSHQFIEEYKAITCFIKNAIEYYQRNIVHGTEYSLFFIDMLVIVTKIKRIYEYVNSNMTFASSILYDDIQDDLGYSTNDDNINNRNVGAVETDNNNQEPFTNMFLKYMGVEGFTNNNSNNKDMDTMEQCLFNNETKNQDKTANDNQNQNVDNNALRSIFEEDIIDRTMPTIQNIYNNNNVIDNSSMDVEENTMNVKELQNQIDFMRRATRYTFFRKLGFYLLLTIVVSILLYVLIR
jgi:hypothetical protein